ncbi:MAG: UDP-2,3-diacylglucosamine diphosphatase [Porticoccaceae bacterium]
MATLFISDLHLSPERPAITRAFLLFLEQRASQASALYILGDLFEAWIGDDDPSELSQQVQTALRKLSDSGVSVSVQTGNRDFLIGRGFATSTGASLLGDEHIVEAYGHRVLVMHGDSLCTDDQAYQRFRRYARNPLYQFLFKLLPVKRRQRIADQLRAKSMKANSNKASAIMDVNNQAVEAVLERHNVTRLIHGHTHRPDRHQHSGGERIVLGDWHDLGWVLCMDPEGFDLQSFVIDTALEDLSTVGAVNQ